MKNHFIILAALVSAACSSPKYTYHFDHYDYNSGKKTSLEQKETVVARQTASPLLLTEQEVVADTRTTPVLHEEKSIQVIKNAITGKMASMTKEEKKEFKKSLKTELKNVVKAKKTPDNIDSTNAKQAWDYDLKMAAIFGLIGLILTALGGVNTVFWILGAVALIVGAVFLIKWLARQ